MIAPAFIPLACPRCSGDLVGRAADAVALCNPCGCAYLVREERLVELPVASVVVAGWRDATLALPFWTAGAVATPAFLSARPVVLTSIASRLLPTWHRVPGGGLLPALGARLQPDTLAILARLARLAELPTGSVGLLAVPARSTGTRLFLPGEENPLFAEDVPEAAALVEAAHRV